MADVGQELGLQPRGFQRRVARLLQRRFDDLPLGDLAFQLPVRLGELRRPLRDPDLQLLVQVADHVFGALALDEAGDRRDQVRRVVRAFEVAVGARAEALDDGRRVLPERAHEQDRKPLQPGVAPHEAAQLDAADVRHHHVADDDLDVLALGDAERLGPVGGGQHPEAGLPERHAHQRQVVGRVVHDEDGDVVIL